MRDAICSFAPSPAYTVESGVPMPPEPRGGGRMKPLKYPVEQMKVGDSFFVPKAEGMSASQCACTYGKKSGKVFSRRKVENGYRVWRIA